MAKGVFNWTFTEVERFLKEHGFVLNYTNAIPNPQNGEKVN